MELKTDRLTLRPIRVGDETEIHEYAGDKDITMMFWLPNETFEETCDFVKRNAADWDSTDQTDFEFVIVYDGKIIGGCDADLSHSEDRSYATLGWIINKKYRNMGFASEAGKALLDFAFEKLNVEKVYAQCDTQNPASYNVMMKIGMTCVNDKGTRTYPRTGKTSGEYTCMITREEWKVKANNSMKTVDILGANRLETYTKTRDGSRAVIVRDGKILLTHELNSGWYLLPGGGMEEGETFEECVIREVEEETGVIVRPLRQFLLMHEYYEEYRYTGYFFVCEVTGKGEMKLTEVEKRRGVQPEWIPLQDAIDMFSKHESYADVSEEKRGAYQREYLALQAYMDLDSEGLGSHADREIVLGGPGAVRIREERISAEEYIDFLKRTDLGSQYPKERFEDRIKKLVKNVSISLIARNEEGLAVGALFGLTDFAYWLYVTDLGVDRDYERKGIARVLMKTAHEIAGGEKDIAVYLIANENAVPFYEKIGMKKADDVMQYNHIEWTEWTVE